MRRALLAFLALVAGLASAAAQGPVAVIPYEVTSDGALMIDVTVDGKGPYAFIVDTGATLTLVFENFALAARPVRAEGPSLRILSISGAKVFERYAIGDLDAGLRLASDHVGVVLPDWDAPRQTPAGIIGLDILENFALAVDVCARTIAFYPRGGLPAKTISGMRKVTMKKARFDPGGAELYTVRGRVNGEPIEFIVDLGLATTLINYAAADALFADTLSVGAGRAGVTGTRFNDVFDDRTRVNTGLMRRTTVGTHKWLRRLFWIYDAPLFAELGVAKLAYGLLGADLMADQDFAIDFAAGRLYFGR